ncbi:4480_t:CDS:1, partial [Paraglomus brasilianum]
MLNNSNGQQRAHKEQSIQEAPQKLRNILENFHLVTVIIATQHYKNGNNEEELDPDVLIIDSLGLKKLFGSYFASRAAYLLGYQVNPNLSMAEHLQCLMKGI